MDKTKESLSIRLLDSHSNPLKNQEFRLFEVQNGRRSIINTIFTSNENGEAFFNAKEVFKEGTQSFEIGLHNTLCYKRKPIYNHRYLLRNYEYGYLCEVKFAKKADDASIEKVTLKPKEYLLDNNEKIILKFYAGGDIVELEAFYDVTKIQEDEIKWGYTLLTASSQEHSKNREHSKNLDTLNKNQLTNDKKDSSLFDDKISTTCCHIEKRGDIAILSGTPIDMMQDNPQAYRGKTIQIALPKTTNQQAILIFAYKNTPNYRASQLIRLNDYPQITIDCTLAETLRAYTRQDNIATLGWGVSYVCQRLWHDNPSDAKELSKLIYIDSHSPDFIESIPNATMQSIVKEVLPRITLKEFSKDSNNKCPAIKSQIQEIKDKNLRFYVELDWDRFYMQFPLMKNLEKEMLNLQIEPIYIQTTGMPTGEYKNKSKILTLNFLHSMQSFMRSKKEILKNTQKTESMQVTANLLEIAKNPKEANIPNANNRIFSITNDSIKLQECEKLLSDIKPSDLGRHHMQYYSISDIDFGLEYKLSFEEKSNQAIALYALSGKFQIYYVLDSFEVERINEKEIAIYPTQIKAYIDDSFDFRDQDHTFNDDGSIKELGQPVGAWDYNEMKFDKDVSESQMNKYAEKSGIISATNAGAALFLKSAINIEKYENYKRQNIYPIYNYDYQQTQKNFNLGLDFLVTSPTFKNITIPNTLDIKNLFKILVELK
ncbi:hypothetical protein PWA69_001461 [Campylobacter coli]|nr:hypothetical protein [Campylobacter coli]